MVAGIIETLSRTGEPNNTYLIFISDDGGSLGARRRPPTHPEDGTVRINDACAARDLGPDIAQEQLPGTETPGPYALDIPSWGAVRTERGLRHRLVELAGCAGSTCR
ncbi:hypothetical protein [Nocardia sp. NPDC052112]|uniref:hypothetical protein n=1 Tax=Nocardia sp. NPDC052112 TaxID=3155646 RepID=UPI0034384765